jgi:hypothetical protein
MSWIEKLQHRWNVNFWQAIAILAVFALTGTTVVMVMKPMLHLLFENEIPTWARIAYYILILPIYNLLLLFYGFLFGQYKFFIGFEKKTWNRISDRFKKKKED